MAISRASRAGPGRAGPGRAGPGRAGLILYYPEKWPRNQVGVVHVGVGVGLRGVHVLCMSSGRVYFDRP